MFVTSKSTTATKWKRQIWYVCSNTIILYIIHENIDIGLCAEQWPIWLIGLYGVECAHNNIPYCIRVTTSIRSSVANISTVYSFFVCRQTTSSSFSGQSDSMCDLDVCLLAPFLRNNSGLTCRKLTDCDIPSFQYLYVDSKIVAGERNIGWSKLCAVWSIRSVNSDHVLKIWKKKIHEICKKRNLCAVSHALSNTCQRPSLFHFFFLLLLLQNYGEIYDQ